MENTYNRGLRFLGFEDMFYLLKVYFTVVAIFFRSNFTFIVIRFRDLAERFLSICKQKVSNSKMVSAPSQTKKGKHCYKS